MDIFEAFERRQRKPRFEKVREVAGKVGEGTKEVAGFVKEKSKKFVPKYSKPKPLLKAKGAKVNVFRML